MKVISYSIFGKEKLYRVGLLKNVELAKKLFPDWKVFIHLNPNYEDKQFLKDINQPNTEIIDLKEEHPQDGFLWRMLPLEQNYDVVIVRDVDTRLFERDKKLVDYWLNSDCKYHLCRDNFGSYQPILGGLWGGKNPNLKIRDNWNIWKKNQGDKITHDIPFLKKYIYTHIRKNLLVFSEHTIYLGETNIIKLGPREKFNKQPVMLGMIIKDDIQESDNEIQGNRNQERLKHYTDYDPSKDPNDKLITILFPKHYFKNPILNFLYLVITFLYFLIDYKKYYTLQYIKQKILRYIFRKNTENGNDHIRLWI